MTETRTVAILMATLTAALVWSCGPQRVRTSARPGEDQVVILPDAETGTVGRATVSNASGSVRLAAARDSTKVSANQAPSAVTVLSESDVRLLFGSALASLPPPARHFTLYFRFDSDDLTDESRALVPEILQAVRERPFPDVLAVGHTDTTGAAALNFELGLKRANAVRNLLIQAGLDRSAIEATSHGETDLLVPTADEVAEPRNRRVEITVR